jgi:hypothetical protein
MSNAKDFNGPPTWEARLLFGVAAYEYDLEPFGEYTTQLLIWR